MRQIAIRLVGRGHQVTVATSHLPERESRNMNGVRIAEFKVEGNLVRGMSGEVDAYRDYVLKGEYELFMVKAAQQWTFDALTPVLDRITKPKLFVPCGFSGLLLPEYAAYFSKMPEWLRKWDRLIFYATDYRDINFAREHGLTRLSIIPNGADEREFDVPLDPKFRERMGIPENACLILTVGSLTGLKGHLELAKAFELSDFGGRPAFVILNGNVPRPDVSWRQGSTLFSKRLDKLPLGRRIARAKAMYRDGGLPRVVKRAVGPVLRTTGLRTLLVRVGLAAELLDDVVGRINSKPGRRALVADLPRADLVQAYLNSDLFAFASKIEYSPLVLYEAAAAGLPFLSVPVGNAREIAEWTKGGVICPASLDDQGYTQVDVAEFARHISSLANDAERLAQLGAQGRRNWERRFTWDKISRMYEDAFEQCIRSRKI